MRKLLADELTKLSRSEFPPPQWYLKSAEGKHFIIITTYNDDALSGNKKYTKAFSFAIIVLPYPIISKNQEPATKTPLNFKTHLRTIYTSRLLNFSNLLKPKELESFSHIITNDDF
ncbi:hypothetical protein Glove_454g28 [Diversispora epigaea]|uniref:Uncharacterized protein n=1 Tax=Diversispora epigaea TaxID=1348612 RepID=A0A397GQV7_9GLOM|nr:hypothetical protein Glove_454g28 [Diversispora epigaea]